MEGILAGFTRVQLQQGLDGGFFTEVQQQIARSRLSKAEKAPTHTVKKSQASNVSAAGVAGPGARRGRPVKPSQVVEQIQVTPSPKIGLKRASSERFVVEIPSSLTSSCASPAPRPAISKTVVSFNFYQL
jgi:hypothetical protein